MLWYFEGRAAELCCSQPAGRSSVGLSIMFARTRIAGEMKVWDSGAVRLVLLRAR